MNPFRKLLKWFFIPIVITLILRGSLIESLPNYGDTAFPGECASIESVPMCKGLVHHQTTMLPNRFGHRTVDEIGLEIHQFYPLVKVGCFEHLDVFLCHFYMPECGAEEKSDLIVGALCPLAKEGCSPIMQKFGFEWPDRMDCDNFSKPAMMCVPLTESVCRERLGYETYQVPNVLGMTLKDDVERRFTESSVLIALQCGGEELKTFLCQSFMPSCDEGPNLESIKRLCPLVRNRCLPTLRKFGIRWPELLNCEQFGVEEPAPDIEVASRSVILTTTASPASSDYSECEPITFGNCQNLRYSTTQFPNLLGHQNSSVALEELQKLDPLFQIECSSAFRVFLCRMHFPECGNWNMKWQNLRNARRMCRRAQSSCADIFLLQLGYEWQWNCDSI